MAEVVRTMDVAPLDRFSAWREVLAQVAMPVEVRTRHGANFTATVRTSSLGVLHVLSVKNPPMDVDRTRLLIRQSDPEVYHLALNLAGQSRMAQERNVAEIRPGDMTFYHSSHPFQTRSDDRVARESAVAVVMPPALLPLPADRLRGLLAVRLQSRDAMGKLVARHLRMLASDADQYNAVDAARLSYVTVDLISVMLARRLDAEASLPLETREQALFTSVGSFVHQRLGDVSLTPELVAAAHHISLRTLHRLFRVHGLTVAGWIRERRLDRCRHDLADPLLRAHSVRTIATRWGFVDSAHFSRAFKAAYGMSPRAYRQHASGAIAPS